jgi:prepilin-type N-terminal cleavage/methylation domain-containing protein
MDYKKNLFNSKISSRWIHNSKQAGFSLLELLIVITIIGVLTSIILTSLSDSRAKAYNSKIKQQLTSFRTAAEIYFSNQNPNGYGPTVSGPDCSSGIFNDVSPSNGSPALYIASGNLPDFVQLACSSTASAYAVKASLYSGNEYWCVDSKGFSGVINGLITGPTTICP